MIVFYLQFRLKDPDNLRRVSEKSMRLTMTFTCLFYMETFIDAEDLSSAVQAFQVEALQRPISWSTWTSTLRYFMETLEDEDVE